MLAEPAWGPHVYGRQLHWSRGRFLFALLSLEARQSLFASVTVIVSDVRSSGMLVWQCLRIGVRPHPSRSRSKPDSKGLHTYAVPSTVQRAPLPAAKKKKLRDLLLVQISPPPPSRPRSEPAADLYFLPTATKLCTTRGGRRLMSVPGREGSASQWCGIKVKLPLETRKTRRVAPLRRSPVSDRYNHHRAAREATANTPGRRSRLSGRVESSK